MSLTLKIYDLILIRFYLFLELTDDGLAFLKTCSSETINVLSYLVSIIFLFASYFSYRVERDSNPQEAVGVAGFFTQQLECDSVSTKALTDSGD